MSKEDQDLQLMEALDQIDRLELKVQTLAKAMDIVLDSMDGISHRDQLLAKWMIIVNQQLKDFESLKSSHQALLLWAKDITSFVTGISSSNGVPVQDSTHKMRPEDEAVLELLRKLGDPKSS